MPPATSRTYEQKHDQDQKEIQWENWTNEGEAFDLISVLRSSHSLQTIKQHQMSKKLLNSDSPALFPASYSAAMCLRLVETALWRVISTRALNTFFLKCAVKKNHRKGKTKNLYREQKGKL